MSKRNGHHRIHRNTLRPSTQDTIALGDAVESRFLDLSETYFRIRKVRLLIPVWIDGDFLRWRMMRVRHKSGDFRNTEAELKSVQEVAQWTLDVNSELRNQPTKVMKWKDDD